MKDYARGWEAGRNSILRNNKSGCCCKFSEDGETITSMCMAHVSLFKLILEHQHGKDPYVDQLIEKYFT